MEDEQPEQQAEAGARPSKARVAFDEDTQAALYNRLQAAQRQGKRGLAGRGEVKIAGVRGGAGKGEQLGAAARGGRVLPARMGPGPAAGVRTLLSGLALASASCGGSRRRLCGGSRRRPSSSCRRWQLGGQEDDVWGGRWRGRGRGRGRSRKGQEEAQAARQGRRRRGGYWSGGRGGRWRARRVAKAPQVGQPGSRRAGARTKAAPPVERAVVGAAAAGARRGRVPLGRQAGQAGGVGAHPVQQQVRGGGEEGGAGPVLRHSHCVLRRNERSRCLLYRVTLRTDPSLRFARRRSARSSTCAREGTARPTQSPPEQPRSNCGRLKTLV
jgi:hypothetical protein